LQTGHPVFRVAGLFHGGRVHPVQFNEMIARRQSQHNINEQIDRRDFGLPGAISAP